MAKGTKKTEKGKGSAPAAVRLTIRPASGEAYEKRFQKESVKIGSGDSNDIVLSDEGVEAVHAMVVANAERLQVVDLGSEGGTIVNGEEVREATLPDGGSFQLGTVKITVNRDGAAKAATPEKKASAPAPEKKAAAAAHKDDEVSDTETYSVDPEHKVEVDDLGIPTFVFKDELGPAYKPADDNKMLQVVLYWGDSVLQVEHFRQVREIRLGESSKNDFQLSAELLPVDNFPLIAPDDGGFAVVITEDMKFEARVDGTVRSREELRKANRLAPHSGAHQAAKFHMGLNDRAAVKIGDVCFVLEYVAAERAPKGGFFKSFDYYFTKVLTLSLVAHLCFLLAMALTPDPLQGFNEDLFKNPNRFAKLILKPEEKKKEKTPKKFELSGSKGGAKHKGDEGKFGKPKEEKKDALASKPGAPVVDPNKKEKDRQIAMSSGIFKALGGKGAVSNVFGPGGLGTGINNALGGLRGTEFGDAGGAGGLGYRGTGPGGGGNSLGIGGLGTHGSGRGTGGDGLVDLGGRGKDTTSITPGKIIHKGSLTREQIERVMRRAHNQIKYCYEKELQRKPDLYGKIVTAFVINGVGDVSSANVTLTTMNDNNVEECIVRVIQRLRFPAPAGGGVVDVTYPFIFKSGGE